MRANNWQPWKLVVAFDAVAFTCKSKHCSAKTRNSESIHRVCVWPIPVYLIYLIIPSSFIQSFLIISLAFCENRFAFKICAETLNISDFDEICIRCDDWRCCQSAPSISVLTAQWTNIEYYIMLIWWQNLLDSTLQDAFYREISCRSTTHFRWTPIFTFSSRNVLLHPHFAVNCSTSICVYFQDFIQRSTACSVRVSAVNAISIDWIDYFVWSVKRQINKTKFFLESLIRLDTCR